MERDLSGNNLYASCCGDTREGEAGFSGGIFQRERDFH